MANTGEPAGHLVEDAAGRRGLLARLVRAQEDERRQIAEDIHDFPAQKMSAVGMRISAIRRRAQDPELRRQIDELDASVRRSIDDLRHLTSELRLPDLEREGLASALRDYVTKSFESDGLRIDVHLDLSQEPRSEVAAVAYRIAQEALREARARGGASRVEISLADAGKGGFLTRIHDDGPVLVTGPSSQLGHPGLATMQERAELAGGRVRVRSEGSGTTVEFWLPVDLDGDRRSGTGERVGTGGGVDVRH